MEQITKQPGFSAAAKANDVEALKICLEAGTPRSDALMWKMPAFNSLSDRSGCTSVTALVSPTFIIVSNSGDSRSVLGLNGGAKAMSYDHKPYNKNEEERIRKAGGTVSMRRVNGDLAVSRAFGDFCYKQANHVGPEGQAVACNPDFEVHMRNDASDEFWCSRATASGM